MVSILKVQKKIHRGKTNSAFWVLYHLKNLPMKKAYFPSIFLLLICLSGCSVIGGIFKAGAVVGIIAVIVVIALIIWIASMFRGK